MRLLYTSALDAVPPDADGPVGTVLAAIVALEAATNGAIVATDGALSGPPAAEGPIRSGVGGLMRWLTT